MTSGSPRKVLSAPIAVQVVALLIAVVAIGQVLTLAILVLLQPPRPSIYRPTEIAAALSGQTVHPRDGRALERTLTTTPPPMRGPGAGPSEPDRAQLAQILGVSELRIRFEEIRPKPPFFDVFVLLGLADPGFRSHRTHGFNGADPGAGPGRPPPDGAGADAHAPPPDDGGPAPGAGPHAGPGSGPGAGPGWPEGGRHGWPGWMSDGHRLVFGDFTAALQQPTGTWVVVSPEPESRPTLGEKRVALWFLACVLVLGPVGYVFARRLVAPISAFATAADRLGRDPNAPPLELTGPAEIGIAARAFNTMQTRLQRYIKDRTSMIAAISHDLRTPLARVRFKMEKASDELRASVGSDLDQMEAMITAVLSFVRDATELRDRTELDLLSVLETAVDDAVAAGGEADLRSGEPLVVEADDLALMRLFANLIDNAIKYGGRADVRLWVEDGSAVVEISDTGPGLPTRELERVFEPFYRAERSRNRETGGIGLGLAVARSIARAHGGDVTLKSSAAGLTAIVRLPLAHRQAKTPTLGAGSPQG